jgi:F0F1-type ATP synthase membrane subunit b/b'
MEGQSGIFEAVALWSQVGGAIAFVIVLVLLFRKYLVPAVEANEVARNAEISDVEGRLAKMKAESARARVEVEQADRDAAEIRARVAGSAAADRERIVNEAKADGERLLSKAEGELARARMAANARLRIEFIEKALAVARGQAASRVNDALNERLVESTVDQLVRGQS